MQACTIYIFIILFANYVPLSLSPLYVSKIPTSTQMFLHAAGVARRSSRRLSRIGRGNGRVKKKWHTSGGGLSSGNGIRTISSGYLGGLGYLKAPMEGLFDVVTRRQYYGRDQVGINWILINWAVGTPKVKNHSLLVQFQVHPRLLCLRACSKHLRPPRLSLGSSLDCVIICAARGFSLGIKQRS